MALESEPHSRPAPAPPSVSVICMEIRNGTDVLCFLTEPELILSLNLSSKQKASYSPPVPSTHMDEFAKGGD